MYRWGSVIYTGFSYVYRALINGSFCGCIEKRLQNLCNMGAGKCGYSQSGKISISRKFKMKLRSAA